MSSTVATDVGLETGVLSTGSRRRAASTRSRLVILGTVAVDSFIVVSTSQDPG